MAENPSPTFWRCHFAFAITLEFGEFKDRQLRAQSGPPGGLVRGTGATRASRGLQGLPIASQRLAGAPKYSNGLPGPPQASQKARRCAKAKVPPGKKASKQKSPGPPPRSREKQPASRRLARPLTLKARVASPMGAPESRRKPSKTTEKPPKNLRIGASFLVYRSLGQRPDCTTFEAEEKTP